MTMTIKSVFRQTLITLLVISGLLAAACPAALAQDDVSWLLEQINGLRASVGIHGYALNAELSAAATQHSDYMAATCDISHTQINGSTPASRAIANGYTGSRVSENIYGGSNAQASNAWAFWVNSSVHYNGMTNSRVNEIGIGVVSGACGTFYTLVFGYRPDVTAPPAPPVEEPAAGSAVNQEPAADAVAEGQEPPPAEVAAVPDGPPPTAVPYVPPPPSRTPTATIPTLTPSATWTITPTHTPSPTGTAPPPTQTPLVLPTVPALDAPPPDSASNAPPSPTAAEVAAASLDTPGAAPPSPVVSSPTASPAALTTRTSPEDGSTPGEPGDDGFQARDLIPFALAGQVVLIVVVGFAYFRRGR
ncbi:MAG: hypothetical protein JW966_12095 [Anaerolineae bacterium]|nr:hypothetical protein [Anaerolineae bacterium]